MKVEVVVLGSPSLIILMVHNVGISHMLLTLCTPTASLEVSPVSCPERRPGMSDVNLLSGISGLLGKKNKN